MKKSYKGGYAYEDPEYSKAFEEFHRGMRRYAAEKMLDKYGELYAIHLGKMDSKMFESDKKTNARIDAYINDGEKAVKSLEDRFWRGFTFDLDPVDPEKYDYD